MATIIRYSLIVLIAIFAILALAWILVFKTPPGKAFILSQAETHIGDALGSDLTIGTLGNKLPGTIDAREIVLTDDDGVWASVSAIELKWHPLALLSKKVSVTRLEIIGADIRRPPPERTENQNNEDALSLSLPRDLPKVEILEFRIKELQSGDAMKLNGLGTITMGGPKIAMTASFDGGNGDSGTIEIDLAPDQDQLVLNADIQASQNGALATFADFGGPAAIKLTSNGTVTDATINMNAAIGDFGGLQMVVAGDLRQTKAAQIDGTFVPGRLLSDIEEFSVPVTFDFAIAKENRGGTLDIKKISTAAGDIIGNAEWPNARNVFDGLSVMLNGSFAEDYRREMQSLTGKEISVAVGLIGLRDNYAVNAEIIGGEFNAIFSNGVTNLKNKLSGSLTVTAPSGNPYPLIGVGGKFEAAVEYVAAKTASLNGFELKLNDGSSIGGGAIFDLNTQAISLEADAAFSPETVTGLAAGFSPQGTITASINASGQIDKFEAQFSAHTPAVTMSGGTAPALDFVGAFSGLPTTPSGELTATARDGAGKMNAILRSTADGQIKAPKISYVGAGFNLDAAGSYSRADNGLRFDVNYTGDERATPWPGLIIAGDVTANGNIGRDERNNLTELISKNLVLGGTTISDLKIFASGPANAINTKINAGMIATTQQNAARNIEATALVNLNDTTTVTVNSLTAQILNNDLSLTQPAVISVDDGVSINSAIAWGRTGTATIDATLSETRWRGDVTLAQFNIPGADGQIDLHARLDTDLSEPASADFTLRSLLVERDGPELRGNLSWDGKRFLITNAPGTNTADMSLSLPAILRRTPTITVTTDGPIDGYFRYDGDIELLTAYMPPELHSLEGALSADFQFSGTTSAPEISGGAALTNGAFTEIASGLSISDIHADARASFTDGQSEIQLSGGALGGGDTNTDKLTLNGVVSVGTNSRIDLNIGLDEATISAHPLNSLTANGAIKISGPLDNIDASGEIDITELDAEIVSPESNGLAPIDVISIEEMEQRNVEDVAAPTSGEFTYNVAINADDRIFVRGRGMESEWAADVAAQSDQGNHLLLGQMSLRRGWLDFSGRRFEFTDGRISFDRLSPNNPTLRISAQHGTSDGITAIISISGRAKSPSIELTSTPSLPQEDIMAIILFGKPAGELTAVESLQTAQALAALGGVGPFGGGGLTGTLRQATGLDLLNFDIDPENGGGSLTIGKYVADGVFVSATQDGTGKGGAVRLQYEITDNISVESEIRQDGDQTVSANWKKDF